MDEIEHGKRKRQIIKEFIRLYESFPCLWHVKSKEYHDRDQRARAYKVLVRKLQQLQPAADRQAVVKKINGLRSCRRKEKRKVIEYSNNGKVYRSRLWYYNLFDFLDDFHCKQRPDCGGKEDSHMKVEEEEYADPLEWPPETDEDVQLLENPQNDVTTEEESMEPVLYEVEVPAQASKYENDDSKGITSNHGTVEATKTRNRHQDERIRDNSYRNELLDDRHDVFGKNVSMKLRHLGSTSNAQRLMAEKVINDALYMAEMGLLTMEHCNILK